MFAFFAVFNVSDSFSFAFLPKAFGNCFLKGNWNNMTEKLVVCKNRFVIAAHDCFCPQNSEFNLDSRKRLITTVRRNIKFKSRLNCRRTSATFWTRQDPFFLRFLRQAKLEQNKNVLTQKQCSHMAVILFSTSVILRKCYSLKKSNAKKKKKHNKEVSVLLIRPRFWEHDAGGAVRGQRQWEIAEVGGPAAKVRHPEE